MKVQYLETVQKEVLLPESAVEEVTIRKLKQLIRPGEYLRTDKDGKVWLKQDDPHHRHGSISEEIVREATDLDKAVFVVLKALKNNT